VPYYFVRKDPESVSGKQREDKVSNSRFCESKKEKRGERIHTDNVRVQGNLWWLQIYPRALSDSKTYVEYASLYLNYEVENTIPNPVFAMADIRTKKKGRRIEKFELSKRSGMGWPKFSKRQDNIQNECTKEGTLKFTVELEIATENNAVWFPHQSTYNYYDRTGSQLYRSVETTSDVTFVVGNGGKDFMVHKCILVLRARALYGLIIVEELSNNNKEGHGSAIIIVMPDIDEKVFNAFLEFVNTGKKLDLNKNEDDDGDIAKLILDAANRFRCTDLKLYIESVIVEKFLVPSNAAALLLLADSSSCALLKEASMNLYVIDSLAVMDSKDDWTKLKESNDLLTELLVYATSGRNQRYSSVVDNADGITIDDVDDLI
jgi:hypothetical protein